MTTYDVGKVNVKNGIATKDYVIPSNMKVGENTITATYLENDKYQLATASSVLTVKRPTTITVVNTLASAGQTGIFSATVLDVVSNENITEGTVQFSLAGSNIGSPVTATNGVFKLETTIPSNAKTGDEIRATYQGNSTFAACVTSTPGILTLRKNINIIIPTISANRSETPNIVAKCTDENGDIVDVGTAILKIDGVQSGSKVTIDSAKGTFTFSSYTVPQSATVGSHTITVEYQQNEKFNAQSGTGNLIVRTPVVVTAVDTSANPGQEDTVLTVTVRDVDNHDVMSGNVEIAVAADAGIPAAVNNGVATITYDVSPTAAGIIFFRAKYIQNENYEESTTVEGKITIRKAVVVQVASVNANLSDTIELEATVTSDGTDVDEGQVNFSIDD